MSTNNEIASAMRQALEKIANVNAMDYEYQRWAREALAIARAEGTLEAEKKEKQELLPRCFADFQPNHEHDRKCEWCAVKTECQTGEAEKANERSEVEAVAGFFSREAMAAHCDAHRALSSRTQPTQPEAEKQEPDDLTIAYMSGVYDGKNKYSPQRQPLTDEHIKNAWVKSYGDWIGLKSRQRSFIEGVRFAEAAHGITSKGLQRSYGAEGGAHE